MSALLIPLAKGFLGLLGVSSLMFVSVRNDVELQIQGMELKAAELQLEQRNEQRKLELKAAPEKK
ncbi:MAG: hypothetical protein ISR39_04425 [Akkermansiaceae bacterium]|nr:hypothetical protein [Akkermansiaceae bacterium]